MITMFKVHMPDAVDKPLLEVLHSGYITQGEKVEQFEHKLTKFLRSDNVVTVNSGTSALTLALRLAGVEHDTEVITTAMTCTATNLPILNLGGVPVFADVDPFTGLINPNDIEHRITPKTKAIMAVDWGGLPVDASALLVIAKRHNLKLIIDAAHSFGTYHTVQADFVCYSLQAIKHITTVDGGILVCKDNTDYHRAKVLRWFGIDRELLTLDSRIDQDIDEAGYKFHMNDVAATIGIVQLDYVASVINAHQTNAAYLFNNLSDYYIKPPAYGSSWLYTLLLPSSSERDAFKIYMESKDIQVSQVHKRNDVYTVFKPYASRYEPDSGMNVPIYYPGLESFSRNMICVPVHWALTLNELQHIVDTANEFAQEQQK